MKPKTNKISVHDEFTINGKKYKVIKKIFNTNLKKFRFEIQSLYDNGLRFSKWEEELDLLV